MVPAPSLPNQTQDQTTLQLPESKGLKRDFEEDEPDMDVDHISWDTSWEQVQINLVSWIQEIEDDIEDKFFQDVIQPKLESYFNSASPTDPLPNLTAAFQSYLNTNQTSPLSDTESDSKVAPK